MTLLDRIAPRPLPRALPGGPSVRTAIIDIGSNSIRLVVYDGPRRLPFILFNEKVMAGLGADMGSTGRIGEEAMARGLDALERFARLSTEMAVDEVCCVATAAVREAANGAELVEQAREIGLDVRVLSGQEEGVTSAMGLLSAVPDADGIVGDLGGGSLELARVRAGAVDWARVAAARRAARRRYPRQGMRRWRSASGPCWPGTA